MSVSGIGGQNILYRTGGVGAAKTGKSGENQFEALKRKYPKANVSAASFH